MRFSEIGCNWNMSKFKYLGCVLNESGAYEAVCRRKAVSGMRVGGTNRSLVIVRGLQLECARVLHEACACFYVWE